MNLMICDGIISLGNLNSEHVRRSLTMSQFDVQNNFIIQTFCQDFIKRRPILIFIAFDIS